MIFGFALSIDCVPGSDGAGGVPGLGNPLQAKIVVIFAELFPG
jgi:hypothetical protein